MTDKPGQIPPDPDEDTELRALAARYFDLWQENWAALLDFDEPEPS